MLAIMFTKHTPYGTCNQTCCLVGSFGEEIFFLDLQALQEEFDNERTDMTSSHNRQKKEMADLMTAMEAEFAEADSEARQEFEAAREEIRNRSSEEYNVLKISLEGQIEELERTFEAAHQAYLQNTGARATAFQTLTTNDAAAARVIEQRMKKLVQMQVCHLISVHTWLWFTKCFRTSCITTCA